MKKILLTLLIFLMASSAGYAGTDIQPLGIEQLNGSVDIDGLTGNTTLNAATGNEVAYTLNYTTNKATSGNDTGLLINMTDTASPGTSLLQDWQVGGVSKASIPITGGFDGGAGGIYTSSYIGWGTASRSVMKSLTDGNITFYNNAVTTFGQLQFGGTTNAFPSLKRSGTTLIVRLADDSADAPIAIGNTVQASVGTASTHKVTIVIGGVTYYLLATNVP